MSAQRSRGYGRPFTEKPVASPADVARRFWGKVTIATPGSCWLWQGFIDGEGYGRFYVSKLTRNTTINAHRFCFEALRGPVGALHLDHLCRVRHCVNPAHMEAVAPRENILRGVSPTAANARKGTCARGHEFDQFSIARNGRTHRRCSICQKASRNSRKALVTS